MRFLNQFGSIIITRTDSENITISVKKSGPNTDALNQFSSSLNITDGVLDFQETIPRPKDFVKAMFRCESSEIDIGVPISLLFISSLQVTAISGNIGVGNMVAGIIYLNSTNGEVTLSATTADFISASTVNGDVTITGVNLTNNSTLKATAVNGDVSLQATQSSKSTITLNSVNGDVKSTIDKYSGSFDLTVGNGDITFSSIPTYKMYVNDPHHKEGIVLDGTSSLSSKTSNGDLTVIFT